MLRYLRSLFPFLLASLGYTLIASAWTMPLLEWQISDVVTAIPPLYQVNVRPSWTTRFGEALLDGPRFGIGDVSVVRRAAPFSDNCGNLEMVVNRSKQDENVEQAWLTASKIFKGYQSIWGWVEIVLAAMYIWWFAISHEHRPAGHVINLTVIAVVFAFILLMGWQSLFASIYRHYNLASDCHGTVTLTATLSKTYFGALAALCAGLCLQGGAIVLMFKMALPKRESST